MKSNRTVLKKTNLHKFSVWLRLELKLPDRSSACYSWDLRYLNSSVEKKTGNSLLLNPRITIILDLIESARPKVRISRERLLSLMYYLSFQLAIYNDAFAERNIWDIQLSPRIDDFAKWIKSHIGYTSRSYRQWSQSKAWKQPSMYAETTIRGFIEDKAIVALTNADKELWPVYLSYLASIAIETAANIPASPKMLQVQTEISAQTEEMQNANVNDADFAVWLSSKNTAQTCRKYLNELYGINATAIKELHHSLIKEQSVDKVTAILKSLIVGVKLDKTGRKVAALYLSYLAQQSAAVYNPLSIKTKTIKPSKTGFENWLVSFIGMGRSHAKAHVVKAEEISAHISSIGFSLFTVNSTFELKALEPIFKSAISSSHILTLDYYYAYMYSSMINIEEINTSADNEEEAKAIQKPKQSFEAWCIGKELGPATIRSMQKFIAELSLYCKLRGYAFAPETADDIVNAIALLDLYTNQQAYREILHDSKEKNYVDRYCLYLLDGIPYTKIAEVLSLPDEQWQYPILVVADKKQVAAKFTTWLKSGRFCDTNSTRTFVSSIYSADDLVREHFSDSLMENPCKRRIAYLRLLAIEKPQFKKDWKRPLRLFVQFLSEFRIISKEEHLENIRKIRDIILLLFNGVIQNGIGTDYQRIRAALRSINHHPLNYSEEDIICIVKQLTIHDKQSDTLILHETFSSEKETNQLIQYVQSVFESGCPVVDYDELRKKLPENKQGVHNDTLRQFLTVVGDGIFTCEARCIRSIDSCKETENIPSIISDKLKEIKKPISKNELAALLPSISDRIITRILGQNNMGINIGIVNPKRENIFHADIIELTKSERTDIIGVIIETLHSNYYITSSQLHKLIKNKVPKLFKRYAFLTKGSLFRVLRYKLKDFFNFSMSCITFSGSVDISSIFKSYCAQHKRIKMSQLIQFEKELGGANIPFEQIYETHARVNQDDLIRRNQLHFDISAIDAILQGICQQTLLPISRFSAYDKLPLVPGFEWTPFLLEHYLSYHSHKFSFYKRNFSRRGCYGFIIPRATDISDFDEAVARYIWLSGYELDADSIVTHLQEIGIIGARKYANIDQIIQRVREIQSLL